MRSACARSPAPSAAGSSAWQACVEYFPRSQFLVLLTDDLERTPEMVVDSVLSFIGTEPGFRPANLGSRYYVGGDEQRFPGLIPAVQRLPGAQALWRRIPGDRRRATAMWFSRQANVKRRQPPPFPAEVRARLADFYRPDVARLESILGRAVPWPDFTDGSAG